MSIAGIGTDIVEIARMQAALERHGARFGERILNAAELAAWERRDRSASFLANRFAAKEAAVKALGCGFRNGVRFRDVEVASDALGKPELILHGAALERMQVLGATASALSISDERLYAVAFVVLYSA